MQPALSH